MVGVDEHLPRTRPWLVDIRHPYAVHRFRIRHHRSHPGSLSHWGRRLPLARRGEEAHGQLRGSYGAQPGTAEAMLIFYGMTRVAMMAR